MMTGQFKACGLTKSYWKGRIEVPVLRGVDLEVERGEMVAVAGSSGSGKSTLLHILGLLDGPDSGEVRFEDWSHRQSVGYEARPPQEPRVRVHLPVLSPAAGIDGPRKRDDARS